MKKKIIIASILLISLKSLQSASSSHASRLGAFARFIPAVFQRQPKAAQTDSSTPALVEPSQPASRQLQSPRPSSHTIERSATPAGTATTRAHTTPATFDTVRTNTLTKHASQLPTNQPSTQAIYDFTSLAQQLAALSARNSAVSEATKKETTHTTYQSHPTVGLGRKKTSPTDLIKTFARSTEQQASLYRNPQLLALLPSIEQTQQHVTALSAAPAQALVQTTQEHFFLPEKTTQKTPNFNVCLEVIEGLNALAQAYGFDTSMPLNITAQSVVPQNAATQETQRNELTFKETPAITDESSTTQPEILSLVPVQEEAITTTHKASEQITDMVKITMASAAGTAITFFVARRNLTSKEAMLDTLETLTHSLRQAAHSAKPATQATLPALQGAQSQPTFEIISKPSLPTPTEPRIHVKLTPKAQLMLPAPTTPTAQLIRQPQHALSATPRPTTTTRTEPRMHVTLTESKPTTLPARSTPTRQLIRQPQHALSATPRPTTTTRSEPRMHVTLTESSRPALPAGPALTRQLIAQPPVLPTKPTVVSTRPTPKPRIQPQTILGTGAQRMPLATLSKPIPAPRIPITIPVTTKPVPKPRIPKPATPITPSHLPMPAPKPTPPKQKQTSNTQTDPEPVLDTTQSTDTPIDPTLSEKNPTKQIEKTQDGDKEAPTKKSMRTPEQPTQETHETTALAQEKPITEAQTTPANHSAKKQTPYELPLLTNKNTQLVVVQGKDAGRTPSLAPGKDAPTLKTTPSSKTMLSGFDKTRTSQTNPAPHIILTELPQVTPTTYRPREALSQTIKPNQTTTTHTKKIEQKSPTASATQSTTSSLLSSITQVIMQTIKACTPLLMTLAQPIFNTIRTLIISL